MISGGLEAKVVLNGANPDADLWRKYHAKLPALFIVSQVEIGSAGAAAGDVVLSVQRADGAKCDRCWNYSTHVGENLDYPTVCERCVAALQEIEREAPGA
jgi:isoleucyl-tRNA synthetase